MGRRFRRRFSIVGKEFDPGALKNAIDALEKDLPTHFHEGLQSLWSKVEVLLDEKGCFHPHLKAHDLWYLAHSLSMDMAEYRHTIDKLQESLDLLTDQCPEEWYDSEDLDSD